MTKSSYCPDCGDPRHARPCPLKTAGDKELKEEAERRKLWARLMDKYGPGWWRHTK